LNAASFSSNSCASSRDALYWPSTSSSKPFALDSSDRGPLTATPLRPAFA
jgi:hypothetical protein